MLELIDWAAWSGSTIAIAVVAAAAATLVNGLIGAAVALMGRLHPWLGALVGILLPVLGPLVLGIVAAVQRGVAAAPTVASGAAPIPSGPDGDAAAGSAPSRASGSPASAAALASPAPPASAASPWAPSASAASPWAPPVAGAPAAAPLAAPPLRAGPGGAGTGGAPWVASGATPATSRAGGSIRAANPTDGGTAPGLVASPAALGPVAPLAADGRSALAAVSSSSDLAAPSGAALPSASASASAPAAQARPSSLFAERLLPGAGWTGRVRARGIVSAGVVVACALAIGLGSALSWISIEVQGVTVFSASPFGTGVDAAMIVSGAALLITAWLALVRPTRSGVVPAAVLGGAWTVFAASFAILLTRVRETLIGFGAADLTVGELLGAIGVDAGDLRVAGMDLAALDLADAATSVTLKVGGGAWVVLAGGLLVLAWCLWELAAAARARLRPAQ